MLRTTRKLLQRAEFRLFEGDLKHASTRMRSFRVAAAAHFILASLLLSLAACTSPRPPQRPGVRPPSVEELSQARSQAPPIDLLALEREVYTLVNQVREEHGLTPLAWNDKLAELARSHSRDMAEHQFFSHVNQRGEDVNRRAAEAGITCRKRRGNYILEGLGENLYETARYATYQRVFGESAERLILEWKTQQRIARDAVDGWLQSPPHRANLLSPDYETQGIGVAHSEEEELVITQNLC